MTRILLIEDEARLSKMLSSGLELEGYSVLIADDGVDGYEKAKREKPDLIILDLMLPGMNGYDVCKALRRDGSDVPILMLTAKGQEAEKVIGFETGADDYVAKPFSGLELMARVKALLRRHKRQLDKLEHLSFDDIEIHFARMEARRAGKPLHLSPREFQILELLARHEGEVVSRRQFLEEVWGYSEMPSTRTVDNQIVTLRQKLAGKNSRAQEHIHTIHGIGYKFVR